MNSSAMSSFPGRQSESLAGMEADSRRSCAAWPPWPCVPAAGRASRPPLCRGWRRPPVSCRFLPLIMSPNCLEVMRLTMGDLRGAEHVLCLSLELGFGDAHGDHSHEAGGHVVALDLLLGVFETEFELARVGFDGFAHLAREGVEEAVHMHAPAGRLHDVDVGADGGVVVVRPAQGDVHIAGAVHDGGLEITVVLPPAASPPS